MKTTHTTFSTHTNRRTFLKALGSAAFAAPFITSGLLADPPSTRVRHASFGLAGMGAQDLQMLSGVPNIEIVALCDVDTQCASAARKRFPKARFYQDWRKLLDAEAGNIDSVNVSTPDHMHAPIGVSSMLLGKAVYGQKPLAHNLYETRRMMEIAREKKVVTQMGIQIHSGAYYRGAVNLLRSGIIGKVKEVYSWSNKFWGDNNPLPQRNDPVPTHFDWDLWLGVREARPFIGKSYYHRENWRKRLDFGVGTLGDMACHIIDPVFDALDLGAPVSVRSEGPTPGKTNWAINAQIILTFKGTKQTAGDTLKVTWYDGSARPPAEIAALIEKKPGTLPGQGSIFVGTDGVLFLEHVNPARLFPREKFADFKLPRERSNHHWGQFIEAVRGNGKTSAGFDFAGPLTEAVLLGGVASRFPKTELKWDATALKFDLAEANQYVRTTYRKGWEVTGL